MKAVVYSGNNSIQLSDVPEPKIESPTDVIIKINMSLKSPITALSDKIGSSEFERINIRGPQMLEAISDALSFILNKKSPEIDDIIWSKKDD